MKKLLLAIIITILGSGVYFGYKEIRRNWLLSSQRDVLLVNKEAGVYSFTSLMEPGDITRAFNTVGHVDKMTDEKIAKLIDGLNLMGTIADFAPAPSLVAQPTDAERSEWETALNRLHTEQTTLCGQLMRAASSQACLFRHYILQLLKVQDVAGCAVIYHADFAEECKNIIENNLSEGVSDTDNNLLIDRYECEVDPESDYCDSFYTQ